MIVSYLGPQNKAKEDVVKGLGVNYISISSNELCSYTIDGIKEYKESLNKKKMDIAYIDSNIGIEENDINNITKIFVLAMKAKIKYVSIYGYKKSKNLSNPIESFKKIVDCAKLYGITLLLRNNNKTILDTTKSLIEFVKNYEGIKVLLDLKECIKANENFILAYSDIKEYVEGIYVSSINEYYYECPLCISTVKFDDFFNQINKDLFKGLVIVNTYLGYYENRLELYKKAILFLKLSKEYKSCIDIDTKLNKAKTDEVTYNEIADMQINYIQKYIKK